MSTSNSPFLKNALYANSIFSFVSGMIFLLYSKAITDFLGLSAWWIILTLGVGLIIYGLGIFRAARAVPVNSDVAKFAVYADLAWVLGSAVLIFANLVPFTPAGKWAIAIIADIVLVFTILQYVGLRKLAG